MKVKEESEKVGLKLNIQKTKTMASSPISSWQIDGETVETAADIILGSSKITVDGDYSHEIKRGLLLGRNVMTNLDSILKSRHYFANNGPSTQGCGFSSSHICMWQLNYKESWGLKNWCLWTVVLEKTTESPLDCKEIQPVHPKGDHFLSVHWKDWCWSWNSNTLAIWYKELTQWKITWCWERFKVGGEGDDRGWDGWMASPTRWTRVWVNSRSWWWTGRPGLL